ncbi:hypothetical protein TanjilG_12282 [Lupinus angustifolius]|uniref:Uncharacterized protein n=1 Tax=Lupinus angustifolius TaxID=3871 RepID=A0A1J7HRX7_LUPAN|nr:hypothetical protein TanjilG_12282 [Lupinus angustifolius]
MVEIVGGGGSSSESNVEMLYGRPPTFAALSSRCRRQRIFSSIPGRGNWVIKKYSRRFMMYIIRSMSDRIEKVIRMLYQLASRVAPDSGVGVPDGRDGKPWRSLEADVGCDLEWHDHTESSRTPSTVVPLPHFTEAPSTPLPSAKVPSSPAPFVQVTLLPPPTQMTKGRSMLDKGKATNSCPTTDRLGKKINNIPDSRGIDQQLLSASTKKSFHKIMLPPLFKNLKQWKIMSASMMNFFKMRGFLDVGFGEHWMRHAKDRAAKVEEGLTLRPEEVSKVKATLDEENAKEEIQLGHPDEHLSWMPIDDFVGIDELVFEDPNGTLIKMSFPSKDM